jgi:hypothetical protein
MTHSDTHSQQQQAEASRYAMLLDWGTRVGVAALLLSFVLYLSGMLAPHVPLADLPALWGLPVDAYLERTQTPRGWGWLAMANRGDMANLLGIALLAGCSLLPLLGLMALYLKRGDHTYAAICLMVAAVIVLAASGVLTGGH